MATIVSFGEILLRLAARPPAILGQEGLLEATHCGAEANVAVALAGFGHDSRMVSALPVGRIGDAGAAALRAFGVDATTIVREAGRMGLYFLSPGAMSRPSEIVYDRAGSVFARARADSFDLTRAFENADWLFVGGITAALGDEPLAALRNAILQARRQGIKVAFDCNYRASLWAGREDDAKSILLELSREADLLFAGRRAIGMLLGRTFDNADPDSGFRDAAEAMFADSAKVRWVAATRREIRSSDSQTLTPLLATRDTLTRGADIVLDAIVDRIGTGDAFAAGILHGIATGIASEECVRFAGGCAAWAHSVSGDFLRASVADIEGLTASGASDVKR